MNNHNNQPEVIKALRGNVGISSRLSTTMGKETLYVAIPISRGDEITDVLRLRLPIRIIDALVRTFKSKIYLSTLVLIAILLLGAFVFSKRVVEPI